MAIGKSRLTILERKFDTLADSKAKLRLMNGSPEREKLNG
jgi:hypothetical protein